jgi:hypothetical protein
MRGCMPLKTFLYQIRSSVLLNGVLVGKTFYVKRGTRQGDPFSTFCCGLFSCQLISYELNFGQSCQIKTKADSSSNSISVHNTDFSIVQIVQYADDTLIIRFSN